MKKCEYCDTELTIRQSRNRFCSKSCSNKWQHQNGIRRDYINDKTMLEWWVQKYGVDGAAEKVAEFKLKVSLATSGENNPMYGRHDQTYGWKKENLRRKGKTNDEIYGVEKAHEIHQKLSLALSDNKNPAYGKVYDDVGKSPYQGWYKSVLFRSSYELTFLVRQFMNNSSLLIKAEPLSISYDRGRRTYRPDYQIDNVIYEIKPKSLVTHRSNVSKLEAGRLYCEEHGLQFVIITEDDLQQILSEQEMLSLENVTWSKRYMKEKCQFLLR